ncbi:MAG TPA: 2-hydroxyacid dehydrogenase [Gemmatimonadaceae bacterium]|nr:2-hydroxyacid dehydrogenase [Gemmatimonadaceae bacterium]
MKVAVFSAKPYEREFLDQANTPPAHELRYLEPRLTIQTAALAEGCDAICAFVNDDLSAPVLRELADRRVRLIALRSAGFNHVDLAAAREENLTIVRVPAYSPYAVAEHAVGLILSLNRHIHRAYARVREGNFALDGLLGFDMHGRTVGTVGTGAIGTVFTRIMLGFGCRVLATDPFPSDECSALGAEYVGLETLLEASDIIALHCPLTPDTQHLMDRKAFARLRPGAMLINTSRGALIDTRATIDALKDGTLGALGLDVYEEEAELFFEDFSDQVIQDDVFSRLLTFPNVLITGHQGFFTREALANISATTVANLGAFESGTGTLHIVGRAAGD